MLCKIKRSVQLLRNICYNMMEAPVIVLLYHRIAELENDPQGLAVSQANFREQLSTLKERFEILRFEEDWSRRKATSFVITFDDGYADNLYQALPTLEELEIPATFFISSGTIGQKDEFWWDKLENIICNANDEDLPDTFRLPDGSIIDNCKDKTTRLFNIQLALKSLDARSRNDYIDELRSIACASYSPRQTHLPLNEDEIRKLAASPLVTIGSHTVNHVQLSGLSANEQKEEIVRGHHRIEELLSDEINVFSYPFGNKNDFNQQTIDICRDAGFFRVAANFPGQYHSWTDNMLVPRHIVRNWSGDEFKSRLMRFKYL